MKRSIGVALVLLVLASALAVSNPVGAQSVQGDKLRIVQLAAQGSLFMGVFNPSPSGMTDTYTSRVWYFLNDPAVVTGSDVQYHSYRCQLVDVKYNVQVPSGAVVWNGTQKKWVSPNTGKIAKSAVTWKCGLGTWVDGQKITLADYLFAYAMDWEWAYQDDKDDKYYSEDWANALQSVLSKVLGLKIDEVTDDYIEYTIYQDYVVPYSKWGTAVGNYYVKPALPWELYNVMSEMVAHGVNGKAFSWSEQPQNGFQIDMIDPDQMKYFKAEAQALLENPIPLWLGEKSGIDAYLQMWGVDAAKAGITTDLAKEGYESVISWVDKYNNALISDGPYYVEKYDPKAMTLVLKLANNKRIGYPGEVDGKKLPWDPYWKEIDIYGTLSAQTAVLAVAKGEYDLYWYAVTYNEFQNILEQYGKSLNPIKSIAVWWSLNVNFAGNQSTGLVDTPSGVQFNPFALREVRFALNWLINRQYIVSQILQGSGAPLYGPEVSGQIDAYARISTVAKAMSITPQGDENYAIELIDRAMNAAAEKLKVEGHKLEKKDGVWYFDGKPVTVKIIARVEDKRLDEGKYIAQILQKAGFKVDLLQWQRTQANKAVYSSDPTTLQWNIYTEGWVVRGIHPVTSTATDFWFLDYYVAPNFGAGSKNPYTLRQVVDVVSNGDVGKFITSLGLTYYNTPDKLKPLLDWTGYDFDMLLFQNSWTKGGKTISIESLDQFWDLYKLAYALHLYNAPRIYTVETWRFFLTNSRITVEMPDPISGVGSFVSARSVKPASEEKQTSTGESETPGEQTSTPTSTAKEKGGICGPAAIVGLAIAPLLLRRRR
ncbi:ABC transporter substrate-binding protein [Thermococcus nautili]|uniref:Putative solute binding protein n=1 Tax=Thermococcus nautili TaxID=195522 RepID=W8P495_9EURY|nr:ABC transporter substrate-binding protein [Thermococcus nautili]AHL22245.1 putative solute binding protein [Thermococcus nautili]